MRLQLAAIAAALLVCVSTAGVACPARADIAYTLTDLGTLGGDDSVGTAVNNSGQVTGFAYTAGGAQHAFLSGPGGGPLTDLGTLGGISSRANGINDSGQVVGWSDIAGGGQHAFLYSGGQMLDLNSLIAPAVHTNQGYGNDSVRNGPFHHESSARQELPAGGFGRWQSGGDSESGSPPVRSGREIGGYQKTLKTWALCLEQRT
jgi:probable HAF family extracellular repeat protein